MEGDMSDPRYTDPRYNNPLSDPVGRRNDNVGGTWGWIAGIVVIALIAVFLIAGSHGVNNNTANLPPGAPGSTVPAHPSTTTGMGGPTQFPAHRPVTPITPTNPPPKAQ
jgi:hypothetical protein